MVLCEVAGDLKLGNGEKDSLCQPLGGFITTLRVMHGPDVLLVAPREGDLASHLAVNPSKNSLKLYVHINPRWDLLTSVISVIC